MMHSSGMIKQETLEFKSTGTDVDENCGSIASCIIQNSLSGLMSILHIYKRVQDYYK
jgi:hypothetical protein